MDRISGLPDSLILYILSLLSNKEVKATSVLSKNWLRINDSITFDLFFDDFCFPRTEFSSFVHRVVRRGTTDIRSVTLCLDSLYDADQTQLWIHSMKARNVKEIYLLLGSLYMLYMLIPELFNCNALEVLHIHGSVHLVLPPLINLPSLKILDLRLGSIDFAIDGTVPKLLSGCPALEEFILVIHSFKCTGILAIRSPKLRKFHLRLCGGDHHPTSIDEFWLNTPALESLDVSFQSVVPLLHIMSKMPSLSEVKVALSTQEGRSLDMTMHARMGFLEVLDHVKSLSFCSKTMKLLDCDPMAVLPLFMNVTKLVVDVRHNFGPTMQLLKHTPNLEWLVLQLVQRESKTWKDWELEAPPQCLLGSLRTIEFIDFRGSKKEMAMAKYLLLFADGLQTMKISIHRLGSRSYRTHQFASTDYSNDSIREELFMPPHASAALECMHCVRKCYGEHLLRSDRKRKFATIDFLHDHNLDPDRIREELSMVPLTAVGYELIINT